jgi:hypothetical protein
LGVTGRLQAEAGGGDAQFRIGPGGFPLSEAVFDFEPGSEVVLVIHRAGEQIEARMRLTTLDPQSAEQEDQIKFLGAYLERVADWKRSGTRYDGSGLICGHVSPGSIAAQAGLQKQDIVERVMFRASDTFSVVDVTNVAALQEAAPQILAEIRRARSSGASVVLGLETYNLESRARKVKLLRTAPLLD